MTEPEDYVLVIAYDRGAAKVGAVGSSRRPSGELVAGGPPRGMTQCAVAKDLATRHTYPAIRTVEGVVSRCLV